MKPVTVIGDIHGCYKTFLALLEKIPKDNEIVLVGDLIDRGPYSKEVVQYVIEHPEIKCVKANHEDMMINDMLGDPSDPYHGQWLLRQAGATLSSYQKDGKLYKELMIEHAKWMKQLPYYIEFPDIKLIGDDLDFVHTRYLVISHASIGSTWHLKNENHPSHNCFEIEALWNRDKPIEVKEIYNIFGHSPVMEPVIKNYYANIDTGCCFKRLNSVNYGKLTALSFPSMEIIQQENIDW